MGAGKTSPIQEVVETWPLPTDHCMKYGRDELGAMWVTVENSEGVTQAVMQYDDYLEMQSGDRTRNIIL